MSSEKKVKVGEQVLKSVVAADDKGYLTPGELADLEKIKEGVSDSILGILGEHDKRRKAGQLTCVTCPEKDARNLLTFSEVDTNQSFTFCHTCAAAVTMVLFQGLPQEYQRQIAKGIVLGLRREVDDMYAKTSHGLTGVFVMLNPDMR